MVFIETITNSFFVHQAVWCGSVTKLLNLKVFLKETPLLGKTTIKYRKQISVMDIGQTSNIIAWKKYSVSKLSVMGKAPES